MVFRRITMPVLVAAIAALGGPFPAAAQRTTLPLDGTWSVAEGVRPEEIPARFDHTVAVPGLTDQAQPAFPDVDRYETHEYVYTMKRNGVLPPRRSATGLGRTPQKRNYFWYERTFTAPARRDSRRAGRQQGAVRHGRMAQRQRRSANTWAASPPAGST